MNRTAEPNKIAVAIAAREAMREARKGKPVAFSWPRWPQITSGEARR